MKRGDLSGENSMIRSIRARHQAAFNNLGERLTASVVSSQPITKCDTARMGRSRKTLG